MACVVGGAFGALAGMASRAFVSSISAGVAHTICQPAVLASGLWSSMLGQDEGKVAVDMKRMEIYLIVANIFSVVACLLIMGVAFDYRAGSGAAPAFGVAGLLLGFLLLTPRARCSAIRTPVRAYVASATLLYVASILVVFVGVLFSALLLRLGILVAALAICFSCAAFSRSRLD